MPKALSKFRFYWVGVASVTCIAIAEDAVRSPIEDKSRFLVLLIPVAGTTWLGGVGPGILTLVLSCFIGVFLYLPPKYSFLIQSAGDVASLILYICVSIVLIMIIENLRRSKQSLADSEAKVRNLNADLQSTLGLKEDALRRQKQFTADASHELKSPLTALRARSSIALSEHVQPAEMKEHMVAINRVTELMNDVVHDLLLLAASDDGKLPITEETSFVRELIEDALASVDSARHDIKATFDPALQVDCDPSAITRVLVNLLQNAIIHTPAGKGISLECEASDDLVLIRIRDEGIGISSEHLSHIFDRFYRADSSRDRNSGGSGLGLAIAKAIVDAHHGTIEIVSELGRGTTVNVSLPKRGIGNKSIGS